MVYCMQFSWNLAVSRIILTCDVPATLNTVIFSAWKCLETDRSVVHQKFDTFTTNWQIESTASKCLQVNNVILIYIICIMTTYPLYLLKGIICADKSTGIQEVGDSEYQL